MAATPEDLMARLDRLGIRTETFSHPPLRTVEESRVLRGDLPGSHIRNLFLRDKKKRMWLVTLEEEQALDLKALGRRIGARGNLSFGSAGRLMAALGVLPGAVTPFALINDTVGEVSFVLDAALLEKIPLNAHPLHNEATTAIAPQDLLAFVQDCGHDPMILDFAADGNDGGNAATD